MWRLGSLVLVMVDEERKIGAVVVSVAGTLRVVMMHSNSCCCGRGDVGADPGGDKYRAVLGESK